MWPLQSPPASRRAAAWVIKLGCVALTFALVMGGLGRAASAAPVRKQDRPKLVVLISVDQFRYDYIARYGGAWRHGLARLVKQGALFSEARYPYLNTVTCAGHSTIGTGAYPHRHGMVLNAWWSRELARAVECTEDLDAPVIRYSGDPPRSGAKGHSARNLQVPTLVDALKGTAGRPGLSPEPRVMSFSSKARSAIGLVGNQADQVTWFDERGWVTSRQFGEGPARMVAKVVAAFPEAKLTAGTWRKVGAGSLYRDVDDDVAEQPPMPFWKKTFPYALEVPSGARLAGRSTLISPLGAWDRSALPDEVLAAFAQAAVADKLGRGRGTDLLALSFSALDSVGHAFGPRSHEVQDVLIRLDRLLGRLLATLDRRVGRNRYIVALTSDHGVAAFPEQLRAEGKDAGRIPMKVVEERLAGAIATELGAGRHVSSVRYTDLYLAPGVIDRLRTKTGAIDRVKAAVRSVPGVEAVFATDELRDPAAARDSLHRAAALSHHYPRSGDLVLAPKQNWITTGDSTTHGTHNDYDQHVPVILFGRGVRKGRYARASSPADIAPTLAHVLGVALPSAEGRVLEEALRAKPRRR